MEALKGFDLSKWWTLLLAVGLALTLGALAVKERDAALIGFGMIMFGFGEKLSRVKEVQFGYGLQVTRYPRKFHFAGVLLHIGGAMLIVYGGYRFVTF